MTYKTIGHTPMGIEVQRDEEGNERFCRGKNIIADEDRVMCGDITVTCAGEHTPGHFKFNYTLISEGS